MNPSVENGCSGEACDTMVFVLIQKLRQMYDGLKEEAYPLNPYTLGIQ